MEADCAVVLDVGKTNAKLTLWAADGRLLARSSRANEPAQGPGYAALDVARIEGWLKASLKDFAARASITAIIPVAHGAAAALVSGGELVAPPMDYEQAWPDAARAAYEQQRDLFALTGSPALPKGLNLGFQLHQLETLTGPWDRDVKILLWPQFWAWRLSGVAASEVTSLGCHSDLWQPKARALSDLSKHRGWAERLPPLRHAGDVLGHILPEWVRDTGVSPDCQVLCGLHDSNAALLAARGHPAISQRDTTILSTGTWFVAMRAPRTIEEGLAHVLDPARDCLFNVDVNGCPVPSARFMGGREAEVIAHLDPFRPASGAATGQLIARLPRLIAEDVMALPSFSPGVGPFPNHPGRWTKALHDPADKRALLSLYLALIADVSLGLVGAHESLLIEGRFAEDEVFVGALARLRPELDVFTSNAHDEVPYGALRLLRPELPSPGDLIRAQPIDLALNDYRARWHGAIVRETA